MFEKRISALREKLSENSLSAYLVTSYENYRYFSGFSGSNCTLIITHDKLFALTDGRYDVQIRSQADGFDITVISRPMADHIGDILGSLAPMSVGYEAMSITDFELTNIKNASGDDVTFVACTDLGSDIRAVKDEAEIACIRRAAKIADEAFVKMCTSLSKGMTERGAAALLDYNMSLLGSEGAAFSTIAASDLRGAMPHAEADNVEIPENCLMTFDFGAKANGYRSDITRTIHIGNPKRDLCDLWELVFEVQQKCLRSVKAGIPCREIDALARELFAKEGMDKYFTHSLGHGVGLAVHESPTLSRRSNEILCKNMIVTIEPGLYIEGLGGVRIEDSVVVTKDGCEILTHAPYRMNINF